MTPGCSIQLPSSDSVKDELLNVSTNVITGEDDEMEATEASELALHNIKNVYFFVCF